MPHTWSSTAAEQFWSLRKMSCVLTDTFQVETPEGEEDELTERHNRDEEQRVQFQTEYADYLSRETTENAERSITIANDLHFWAVYRSWTFCQDCGSLDKIKLMPSFQSKLPVKWNKNCHCKDVRYIVPCIENIPECLKNLTYADIITLRPVEMHVGDYKRLQHGYRQKTNMCRVTWSNL